MTRKKYKSPSTRRRDKACRLAWKNSRRSTSHIQDHSFRKVLFTGDTSASEELRDTTTTIDNHLDPDRSEDPDSESQIEAEQEPSPEVSVKLVSGEAHAQFVATQVTGTVGRGDQLHSEDSDSLPDLSIVEKIAESPDSVLRLDLSAISHHYS